MDFLSQNDAAIDRFREIALRCFEEGPDGLRLISQELSTLQSLATAANETVLFDCLSDVSTILENWQNPPISKDILEQISSLWADVIYELSNYLVFMSEEDQVDLRQRVSYRLVQLTKAFVAICPEEPKAKVEPVPDGSWGLFEAESPAQPAVSEVTAAAAAPPVPSLPQPPAPVEDNRLASHYLICLLGSQQYALPIHQVREILEQRAEKSLPLQRPGIVGLVTVRGLVCPVIDVSHILHAKIEEQAQKKPRKRCMVVCEVDRRTFCFNVDDVKQVAAVEEFDEQITPLMQENPIQKAISHVSHFQRKSVLFVKMREVIPA